MGHPLGMHYLDLASFALFGTLLISGVALAFAAWLPRKKEIGDWLMAVGATLMPTGLGVALAIELLFSFYSQVFPVMLAGAAVCGAALFAFGFVLDRLGRRSCENYEAVQALLPGQEK